MIISLKQIVEDLENLNALKEVKMPTKVAYWINRIYDKANSAFEEFKNDRFEVIKSYGKMKDDKINFEVPAEKMDEFSKKVDTMLLKEVDLNANEIPLSSIENLSIEPRLMIHWIFTDK